jgi:hypothetical protein
LWDYSSDLRRDANRCAAWSEIVNRTFLTLMGEPGAVWAVRHTAAALLHTPLLRSAIDSHSEVGVFTFESGSRFAFHSRGDLFAGVVLRLIRDSQTAQYELDSFFARCTTSPQSAAPFGVIGKNHAIS